MLLQARDSENGAGHETTANALTWCWCLLADHPGAEHEMHRELDATLDDWLPDSLQMRIDPRTAAR